MNETKEKNAATAEEMANVLTEFLKANIVGVAEARENGFAFRVPGGKTFLISIKEE